MYGKEYHVSVKGNDSNSETEKTSVKLKGDGITDDAAAIQALLDTKTSVVYLPPPKNFYLTGKSLRIHSNQTIRLDPTTKIRLANNANDYMLINADQQTGDTNIHVIGGIWDGNNLNQVCEYRKAGSWSIKHLMKNMGSIFYFFNVKQLHIEGLTLKDPEMFGAHLANVHYFTVCDITLDYNYEQINEDGIHLKGPCSFGLIRNIKGNSNDDLVALNAGDQPAVEPSHGPITDIRIDGLFAPNGYTAVRLLSGGNAAPVKRIHISNIFGCFHAQLVYFSHYNVRPDEQHLVEDITVDNVFVARQIDPGEPPKKYIRQAGETENTKLSAEEVAANKAEGLIAWFPEHRKKRPLFWVHPGMTVRNITFSNIVRREYLNDTRALFFIEKGAEVDNLTLRDVLQENHCEKLLPLIQNDGHIGKLRLDAVSVSETFDKNQPLTITGEGKIDKISTF
jgi:hypothetical protein